MGTLGWCRAADRFAGPLYPAPAATAVLPRKHQNMNETLTFDPAALRRRLGELQAPRPLADPATPAMRIGIADAEGELLHVVETASLSQAVKVFELLGDLGLEPCEGRHRSPDGRRLTRLYSPARG